MFRSLARSLTAGNIRIAASIRLPHVSVSRRGLALEVCQSAKEVHAKFAAAAKEDKIFVVHYTDNATPHVCIIARYHSLSFT